MLMGWHEKSGWFLMNLKTGVKGRIITIKAVGKTDLGALMFELPRDNDQASRNLL